MVGPFTAWTDPLTSEIRRGLEGMEVREGGFWFLDQAKCGEILPNTGTCFGAHPASPYGMFDFPEDRADDEGPGILDHQMEQHEAIVFVGYTPPTSRYYSFNHHQYRKVKADGSRLITFGTLAPSMHLLGISTASSRLLEGFRPLRDAPFQDYTVVVFTANATTASRVTEVLTPLLEDMGHSRHEINVHAMAYATPEGLETLVASGRAPEDVFSLTMGYGERYDTFNVVLRVAGIEDETHPYLDPSQTNAAIFKLRLDDPPDVDPFPWPTFPPPVDSDEAQKPRLETAQLAVVDALQAHVIPASMQTRILDAPRAPRRSGAACINELDRCGANNDDALYFRTEQRLLMPDPAAPGSVFVVGVNHAHVATLDPTAPAVTYNSITLNNFSRGFGVRTALDVDLRGSLSFWFPNDELGQAFPLSTDELDALYVVQYARDCDAFGWQERFGRSNPYCVEFDDGLLGVCPGDKLWFTERVYLNQTTGTAPAASSVFGPVTIAVGPSITWSDVGSNAGVGGAWALSEPPATVPEPAPWCAGY